MAARAEPHLLQTVGWAALKASAGWRVRRFVFRRADEDAGLAQVLLRPLPFGLSVAYAPRGPLVASGDLPDALVALRHALVAERCVSVLADPEIAEDPLLLATLADVDIRRSRAYVQPRRTLLVDLAAEPEQLLGAMRKKTRQYVHKAERAGVVTEETADLARFTAVLRRVAERDRFATHDPSYFDALRAAFGDGVHVFIARVGASDAGALLVVRQGARAWELFGGWNGLFGEQRPFYLLKWRTMLAMRARGVTRYDMWGLDESGALAGVENFKRGFGGEVATWVGALESPVIKPLYPLWSLFGRRRLAAAAGG